MSPVWGGHLSNCTIAIQKDANPSARKTTVPTQRSTVAEPVDPQQKAVNEASPDIETATAGSPAEVAEMSLDELVAAAKQGDATVMPRLRKIMWQRPNSYEIVGDLAGHARLRWIDLIAGRDLYKRESLHIKIRGLHVQFNRDGCCPSGKMLADEVIITWLPE